MSRCLSYDSWQEVPTDHLDASDSQLQDAVAEKVRLDGTTIFGRLKWGMEGPESKLTFKTTALKLRRRPREGPRVGRPSHLCRCR